MKERISACITAGNEEANIRRCLQSIKWTDEIVVVDSFSTDATVEICKEYTARVYKHEWLGYIGQKNLIKDLASGPWILFIDADEEVSPELAAEIQGEFRGGACADWAAYEFPRMVKYLGRWITHGDWYPDVKLRLFRKELGTCGGREPHDCTTVDGAVKRLHGHLYHYTYASITDQIVTINKFSTITATQGFEDGRPFRLTDLVFRPLVRFLRCYFLRRGFMDGLPGLIIAVTTSYGVFAKYAKLWEVHRTRRNSPGRHLK
jgi:glycosyltransferase involved in cell wall biosynthesis